jgi:hypothetical protein
MLPTFETFATKPSWHNRAGRIDRSACVELKPSDLWRDIPRERWRVFAPKPLRTFLLATTTTHITARELVWFHDGKNPHILKGDLRTCKSNALKPAAPMNTPRSPRIQSVSTPARTPKPIPADYRAIPPMQTLLGRGISRGNPNKGASRTKMLGLPHDWSQPLTINRYRFHARLTQHFFACPNCKKRTLKLFLPLCTDAELRDADFARLWIDSHPTRIARSPTLRPHASRLIERYGPLFPPRRMLCRKCLNLRYGDVRP